MCSARSRCGQLEDDPNEAIATIEADQDPAARAEGFLALADGSSEAQGPRRLELIDRGAGRGPARRGRGVEARPAPPGRRPMARAGARRPRHADPSPGAGDHRVAAEGPVLLRRRGIRRGAGRDRSPHREDDLRTERPEEYQPRSTRRRSSATAARPPSASPRSIRRRPSGSSPRSCRTSGPGMTICSGSAGGWRGPTCLAPEDPRTPR